MGTSKSEGIDGRWLEHVKRIGYNSERLDACIEKIAREGSMKLKRVSYKFNGVDWLVTVTAEVDGKQVVQFANVTSIGGSAGKLTSLLQQPLWKADKFAEPAPHPLSK